MGVVYDHSYIMATTPKAKRPRIFCSHCQQNVGYSTFYRHRQRFCDQGSSQSAITTPTSESVDAAGDDTCIAIAISRQSLEISYCINFIAETAEIEASGGSEGTDHFDIIADHDSISIDHANSDEFQREEVGNESESSISSMDSFYKDASNGVRWFALCWSNALH